jgi:ankyrin repeat protein
MNELELLDASRNGNFDIVMSLLESGVDVNAVNNSGGSVLHEACFGGHIKVVAALLASGADVDAVNNSGYTSFHTACMFGYLDVSSLLLSHGADINFVCSRRNCNTILETACLLSKKHIVEFLLNNGADVSVSVKGKTRSLCFACIGNDFDTIRLLVNKGAVLVDPTVSWKDKERRTTLSYVCRSNNTKVMGLLLELGVDINIKDEIGATPLFYAYRNGLIGLFRFLLENGADINVIKGIPITKERYKGFLGHVQVSKLLTDLAA